MDNTENTENLDKYDQSFLDYKNGMSISEIAKKYDVTASTVYAWKDSRWGAPKPPTPLDRKKIEYTANEDLPPRYQIFCLEYVEHFNQTKAYQVAFPNCTYHTARVEACKVMAKPEIKNEIKRLRSILESEIYMNIKDIAMHYVNQINADITDFIEFGTEEGYNEMGEPELQNFVRVKDSTEVDGRLIRELTQSKDGTFSIKLWDKQKAMERLERYLNKEGDGDGLTIVINNNLEPENENSTEVNNGEGI